MTLGYRAILRLSRTENAISVAESQLSAWLRGRKHKGIEVSDWDGPGRYRLGNNAELLVVHAEDGLDGSQRRLYRMDEANPSGAWIVSLYALSAPQARSLQQTLVVEVSTKAADARDAVTKTAPPTLMRQILDTHAAHDGAAPLTGMPQFVRGDRANEVLAAIQDQDRTTSVVVAPVPWTEHEDNWRKIVASLTVDSVGVASTFVTDAKATEILNKALPPSHSVAKGVVRTYAPRVDTEASEDRLRHLMLFPDTLARSLVGKDATRVAAPLSKRHAESTRLRYIERELPKDVRRGIDLLRRAEAEQLRAQAVKQTVSTFHEESRRAAQSTADAPSERPFTRLTQIIRRWVGPSESVSEESVERLGAQLEAKTAEIALLEEQFNQAVDENAALRGAFENSRSQFDELHLAVTIAEDNVRDAERTVTQLRQRLVEHGKPELAFVAPEEDVWKDVPDDMYELLARITPGAKTHPAFEYVVFTGDEDKTLDIERYGQGMRYAHAFWDSIHVLHAYAEGRAQGRIQCGVHGYLQTDHIIGHKCPPDRHASGESDMTLRRWGKERTLPVPKTVDPKGMIVMAAHFRPPWSDQTAPRMHYYDDTANTGKVYIGYIGRHLKNTKS
ncbi:hypothetical protein ACWDTP_21855 [Mycobacterium sp. NPDC003449]